MPNPHFDDAMRALGDPHNSPEAAATLALAYQAETANLIAYSVAAYEGGLAVPPRAERLQAIQVQIEERLGLA